MKQGIDISHHNGNIDFKKVKAAGIEFAYIKATEGTTIADAMTMTNAKGCASVGIDFGYYHFARPRSSNARLEANWFAKNIRSYPAGKLAPVLDLEVNDSKLTKDQLKQWTLDFIDEMKANGYPKVVLYSYASFLNDNLPDNHGLGYLPLWIASYRAVPSIPKGWSSFSVWQYSSTGSVPGINGNVDMNRSDFLPVIIAGGALAVMAIVLIALIFINR